MHFADEELGRTPVFDESSHAPRLLVNQKMTLISLEEHLLDDVLGPSAVFERENEALGGWCSKESDRAVRRLSSVVT